MRIATKKSIHKTSSNLTEATKTKEEREGWSNSYDDGQEDEEEDMQNFDPWAETTTQDPLFDDYDTDDRAISSTDCDCPSDCEETIYFMEMTQSRNMKIDRY